MTGKNSFSPIKSGLNLDDHDVFFFALLIGQTLIADFDLGEVEAASFGAGAAAGGEADREAASHKRHVDLPGAEARAQAPNVLQYSKKNILYNFYLCQSCSRYLGM